jgi:replicative DNA helicase
LLGSIPAIHTARQLTEDLFADIQDAAEGAGACFATRLKTGFWVLDVMTQGLRQGSLVVLAGSTGTGKTSLALNIARNICLHGDVAVHICTLDSSPTALLQRMLASMCSIEGCRIGSGRLNTEEWPQLGEAMSKLSAAPLSFSGHSVSTVAAIRSRCQELATQSEKPLGLVVIDSLQLLAGDPAHELKDLRLLAAELETCVLLTCQSLPSVELRPGGVPLMHDLPALGAMQTYPHVIGMLHREEFWNPDVINRGEAKLIILKNSDNPVGSMSFRFEPMFSSFIEES